jgi:carbamoyl-phosphate synthase small subunit
VVAIAGIDTRKLTRILREKGAQNGALMAGDIDVEKALEAARKFPGLKGMDRWRRHHREGLHTEASGPMPTPSSACRPSTRSWPTTSA